MSRQIQSSAAYCRKCMQSGKCLKSVIPQGDGVPLDVLEEPNQEIQLEFLGPLPAVCGLISYRFSKFPSFKVTTRTTAGVI